MLCGGCGMLWRFGFLSAEVGVACCYTPVTLSTTINENLIHTDMCMHAEVHAHTNKNNSSKCHCLSLVGAVVATVFFFCFDLLLIVLTLQSDSEILNNILIKYRLSNERSLINSLKSVWHNRA